MTARMRTINEAIAAIRESDPQTAFTPTALRRMIKRGEIPSISVGNKYLVNLDTVISYLNNPSQTVNQRQFEVIGIRKIKER